MGAFANILNSHKAGGFQLTRGQFDALNLVKAVASARRLGSTEPVVVLIKGYAGTGKTTLIRYLCQELHEHSVIVAPTGKAASRIWDVCKLRASTIHGWMYKAVEAETKKGLYFELKSDEYIIRPASGLVFVDEASMISREMWEDMKSLCIKFELCVVLIGDGFQLPPVDAKNDTFSVFSREFSEQKDITVAPVLLTDVVRQQEGSRVLRAATFLRQGLVQEALAEIPGTPKNKIEDVFQQVRNRRGTVLCRTNATRLALNASIRRDLGYEKDAVMIGEPLVALKNNYHAKIMNGESFVFTGWEQTPWSFAGGKIGIEHAGYTLSIEQLNGKREEPWQFAALEKDAARAFPNSSHVHANYGYCLTTHKAQGSQWPEVLVLAENLKMHLEEDQRWLYTAITRAEQEAHVYWETL